MASIDLIVLGIIKKQPASAYDIQKLVEYRNISKWVKISTPSIYKKVLQLEEKGYIKSTTFKERNMAEKAVYTLTEDGETEFKALMTKISMEPIRIFLDFNAVIVNLDSLTIEEQRTCLKNIEDHIQLLKLYLIENIKSKENEIDIPATGKAVLQQQMILTEAIEEWIASIHSDFDS